MAKRTQKRTGGSGETAPAGVLKGEPPTKQFHVLNLFIYLVPSQIFPKTNTFYPLVHTPSCACQGVRNVRNKNQ